MKFLKRLFCKHKYKIEDDSIRMAHGGMDKCAIFTCEKCGKEIWTSIFNKKIGGRL